MPRTPDALADWFVGGRGKRALLRRLVDAAPGEQFTQKELADAAGLHDKGSAVRHLQVLEQANLLARDPSTGVYVVQAWPLRAELDAWLASLDAQSRRASSWRRPLPPSRGR
jgi:hypothetical protein